MKVYVVYESLDYGLSDMNDVKIFAKEDDAKDYADKNGMWYTEMEVE